MAYIKNLGGTVSAQATKLARELWMLYLERYILLEVQHLPGKENFRADTEPRVIKDCSNWMLNPLVFQRVLDHFPFLEVDLCATRLTFQLSHFFSWRPDPLAEVTGAFFQHWRDLKAYASPPWNPIGGGKARIYVFTVLPFGLATACYIFTRHLRPLVKLWLRSGAKIVMYLDERISAIVGKENTKRASGLVRGTLKNAGSVTHNENLHWELASSDFLTEPMSR